jgi:hypothetical protein
MNRALIAIVRARLFAERRAIIFGYAAAILVGALQPHGAAGPVLFCSLVGIANALLQGPGRHRYLDLCEQSAPLFGREMARAKALLPCVAAVSTTVIYVATQGAVLRALPDWSAMAFPPVVAATLIALSATLRDGVARALYVVLAMATSATALAIALVTGSVWIELLVCAIAGYVALRQYGEALARYDPV